LQSEAIISHYAALLQYVEVIASNAVLAVVSDSFG
jgi:DNA mismatch repair protein MSH4